MPFFYREKKMSEKSNNVKLFYVTNSRNVPKPIGVIQDPQSLQGMGELDMKEFGWDGKEDNWLYDIKNNLGVFSPLWVYSDLECTNPLFIVANAPSNCYIRVRSRDVSSRWDETGHYIGDYLG